MGKGDPKISPCCTCDSDGTCIDMERGKAGISPKIKRARLARRQKKNDGGKSNVDLKGLRLSYCMLHKTLLTNHIAG